MERDAVLFDATGRPISRPPVRSDAARAGVGSGASIFGGQFMPFLVKEPDELRTQERRHETYRVMGETDAYIAEVLRANTLPLIAQAKWRMSPALEPKKGEEPTPEEKRAQDVSNFLAANILGQECEEYGAEFRQQTPWTQFLREVLKFLSHGFVLFHKQPKVVSGKLVYRRLLWLEPMTIFKWDIDGNDELRGVYRNYMKPDGRPVSNEYLPVEELALFGWDVVGTRLEGLPLIRPMFGPWKREEFIARCKMIAVQQAGVGVPIAKWDPTQIGDMINADEFADRVEQALQSMLGAGIGTAYLAVPNPTFDAFFLKQEPETLQAFDKLAAPERLAKAHAGGTKSQMLGELPGGARATGSMQRALEYVMAQAIADVIAEQIEMGVGNVRGLIPELTDWNFSGIKRYSKLVADDVDPEEKTRSLPTVIDGAKAGIVKYRPSLEQMFLDRAGFKLPDDEFDVTLHPELTALPIVVGPGGQPRPPARRPGNTPPDGAIDAKTVRAELIRFSLARTARLAAPFNSDAGAKGYGRTPTAFESQVCLLGQISGGLKTGSEQIGSALRRSRAAMIEDLTRRIEAGKISRDTLTGLRRSKPKGEAEMVKTTRDRFMDVARLGRQHAKEELARQSDVAGKLSAGSLQRWQVGFEDAAPDGEPSSPNVLPAGAIPPLAGSNEVPPVIGTVDRFITELAGEARVATQIAIDEIWAALLDEAIAEYNRAIRSGLSEPDALKAVEAALQRLSPASVDLTARQVAEVAYNEGRDVAAKEAAAAGLAEWVLRSEVLDQLTCEPCSQLDGIQVRIGTTEYEQLMPPARCEGGDNCRGFYVILGNDLVDAMASGEAAA